MHHNKMAENVNRGEGSFSQSKNFNSCQFKKHITTKSEHSTDKLQQS
jgi:hypothetical protein